MGESKSVRSMIFPAGITKLPRAEIPVEGLRAYLSQGEGHQVIFMEFEQAAEVPEHSHEAQWAVVLTGEIEMTIDGQTNKYKKGDTYYIPAGVKHGAKIHAGYADVTFFDEAERYKAKETK